jgi:hypothetical protein
VTAGTSEHLPDFPAAAKAWARKIRESFERIQAGAFTAALSR